MIRSRAYTSLTIKFYDPSSISSFSSYLNPSIPLKPPLVPIEIEHLWWLRLDGRDFDLSLDGLGYFGGYCRLIPANDIWVEHSAGGLARTICSAYAACQNRRICAVKDPTEAGIPNLFVDIFLFLLCLAWPISIKIYVCRMAIWY
jgi:hypothetical protein